MALSHWQSLVEILASGLLNSVAEGVAIALLGLLAVHLLGQQNSSIRFALLFSALGAVAAVPIAAVVWPGIVAPEATIHSALSLPGSWATVILIAWAVIAAVGLVKIAVGYCQLRKLRRSCVPLESKDVDPGLNATLQRLGSARNVTLCSSNQVRVPTAIGFTSPAIVIPTWALTELTPVEFNAIVLHELAHLRRWDDWTNLAQKIVRAVLFFDPAVWWLSHGLAREREMACDDFVLSTTSDRRAYAQCLVSVAEKTFLRRGLALAQALVGRVQLTAQRVARILAGDRPVASRTWKPAFALVGAFSAVCLLALPHLPKLVAFDQPNSGIATSSFAAAHPTMFLSDEIGKNFSAGFGAKMIPASFNASAAGRFSAHPANREGLKKADLKIIQSKIIQSEISLSKTDLNKTEKQNSFSAAAAPPADLKGFPAQARPRMTNAAFAENAIQSSAFLVVMQTDRIDEYGQTWSVCVWQLTVFHPNQKVVDQQIRKGIAPKST